MGAWVYGTYAQSTPPSQASAQDVAGETLMSCVVGGFVGGWGLYTYIYNYISIQHWPEAIYIVQTQTEYV